MVASYLFPLSSGMANSRVTSKYNIRRAQFGNAIHGGIDLVADGGWVSKNGQPDLLATIGGTIYLVKYEAKGFGNYCVIRGNDGYYHIYGHMRNPAPWQVGQSIGQGQKVGDIGSTGHSTGIHLHYEVRQNFADKATRLDPCQLLGIANETGKVQAMGKGMVQVSSSTSNNAGYTAAIPYDYTYEELMPLADTLQKGDYLFGRRCRILVSDDNGNGRDFTDLHIIFQIVKTYLMDIQYSVIKIYNVNRDAESFILRKATTIHVEAGYEGAYYGEIFQGDIIQAFGHWDGTDFIMEILAADSERFLNAGFIANNIERGMTQRQAVEQIAAKASIPVKINSISDGLKESTLPRGKVFFGMAKDYLDQIAQGSAATLYMHNGEVNIIKATDLPKDRILKLSPSSGLIGQPQQTELGIKAKCLLLPQLKVERCVQINSQYIKERQLSIGTLQTRLDPQGVYKIAKVTYSGDNRGNDWYAEFEAMTQSGYLPALLTNSGGNPF